MIRDEGPSIAACRGLLYNDADTVKKILTVFVIEEYLFPLYSPDNDVMKGSRGVYAGLTGHEFII